VHLSDGDMTSVERCRLRSAEFPVALLQSQNRITEVQSDWPLTVWRAHEIKYYPYRIPSSRGQLDRRIPSLKASSGRYNNHASSRIDPDPPVCIISPAPNGSPDLVFGSKRLMSEGSLTGRLSLWRGSWMVASVSP
jgi:hypothetical protein